MRRVALAAVLVAVGLAGCGGDEPADDGPVAGDPRVDLIADAADAIEAEVGADVMVYELAATPSRVEMIVADEPGHGVLYTFDGSLAGPTEPRDDRRQTFAPSRVAEAVDAEHVFDGIYESLDQPVIVDIAAQVDGGALVLDATVASEQGGSLLVLLNGRGDVLGTQPL